MFEKHFPQRMSMILAGSGYLVLLASSLIAFHCLAAGPLDLRPYGAPIYAQDPRNPLLASLFGLLTLLAFNEYSFSLAGRLAEGAMSRINPGSDSPWLAPGSSAPFSFLLGAGVILFLFSGYVASQVYFLKNSDWMLAGPMRYVILTSIFKSALASGEFYPRWLHDLFYGYGYPTFVFYPPGYFYFSSLVSGLAGLAQWASSSQFDALAVDCFTLALVLLIGGAGAFLLASLICGPYMGLACALLFLYSPYLLVNLQFRADFSELFSQALCPYPFYFFLRMTALARSGSAKSLRYSVYLALAMGLVFISHPATSLFLACILLAYGLLVVGLSHDGWPATKACLTLFLASFGLGLAISSPYWLHVLLLKSQVQLHVVTSGPYDINRWAAGVWDFFRPDPLSKNFYQLGLPHFLLCAAGAWLNRKDPRIIAGFIVYILIILSLTRLGSGLWTAFDLVRYVQFPWRIQALMTTLQVIGAGAALAVMARNRKIPPITAYAVIIASFFWYLAVIHPRVNPIPSLSRLGLEEMARHHLSNGDMRMNTLSDSLEFAPKNTLVVVPAGAPEPGAPRKRDKVHARMKPVPRPKETAMIVEGKGTLDENPYADIRCMEFTADMETPGRVRINQIYFPGWAVIVDGRRVEEEALRIGSADEAVIKFPLPAGVHFITAYYEGPPHWRARNGAIIVVILFYIGALLYARKLYLFERIPA